MEKGKLFEKHTPKRLNNATLLHSAETGSEDWAFSRQFGIGGSEVSSILGLNSYKSAYTLWAEKTGLVTPDKVEGWAVRLGVELEEPILKMWAEDNPEYEVFLSGTYSWNDETFMQASPDALARHRTSGEWIIIEAKTARYGWSGTPVGYRAQVFHYMTVLGIYRSVVIGIVGWDWFEEWIDYEGFEASAQTLAITEFWKLVESKSRPQFDGSDSTYETVRKLHPDIDPELHVEIDGLHLLGIAQENFDTAKETLLESKSSILDMMGKAKSAYVEVDGEKITVVTRQARGMAAPYLVMKKGKK